MWWGNLSGLVLMPLSIKDARLQLVHNANEVASVGRVTENKAIFCMFVTHK